MSTVKPAVLYISYLVVSHHFYFIIYIGTLLYYIRKNKICFGKDFRGNYLNQAAPGPCVACWFGPADLVQVVAPWWRAASWSTTPPPLSCRRWWVGVHGFMFISTCGCFLLNINYKYLAPAASNRMNSGMKSTFSILVRSAWALSGDSCRPPSALLVLFV